MTAAEVYLWGSRIGAVLYDPDRRIGSFEYDPSFITSQIEISPITMPLAGRVYEFPELSSGSFCGLPGLLADSLPDRFGNAIINASLRMMGKEPQAFDPVMRLCQMGQAGMGALEFVPAAGPVTSGFEKLRPGRLVRLASDMLNPRKEMQFDPADSGLIETLRACAPAGGSRPKAIVSWDQTTGDMRSGLMPPVDGYGYWIMKLDGVSTAPDRERDPDSEQEQGKKKGEDANARIEYAFYLMALDAGIQMSECRLYQENERTHFMTRRFDRDPNTGRKIHMQSLGGIAHFDYTRPGTCSYEQAGRVMRRLRISNTDLSQLFRRMVFNVVTGNRHDHVKNISFLMDRAGKWRLSPAYDLVRAEGYGEKHSGPGGGHQMLINGKREHIQVEDLMAAARDIGVRKGEAETIIEIVQFSVDSWRQYAQRAGISEVTAQQIGRQFVLL